MLWKKCKSTLTRCAGSRGVIRGGGATRWAVPLFYWIVDVVVGACSCFACWAVSDLSINSKHPPPASNRKPQRRTTFRCPSPWAPPEQQQFFWKQSTNWRLWDPRKEQRNGELSRPVEPLWNTRRNTAVAVFCFVSSTGRRTRAHQRHFGQRSPSRHEQQHQQQVADCNATGHRPFVRWLCQRLG